MLVSWGKAQGLGAIGLLLLGLVSGCGDRATGPEEAAVDLSAGSTPTATAEVSSTDPAGEGFQSTVINPMRTAYLSAQQPGAQINLRSQPTTQSPVQGQGQAGDEIQLLRLAEGEGGFSWYYLKVVPAGTIGWVRGDLINTSGQASTTAATATTAQVTTAAEASSLSSEPCGGDRQEAYFETQSFKVYICNGAEGLRYIGVNQSNQESLTTEDVSQSQGTYIAINGDYQYHVNENSLAVYQVNQGSYTQLLGETVTRHEQFLY
ncbi:MAG: SH3 domain-containing protein [Leptolyngbyaceae cyanobacterium SM2_3_12]|nr:SH3 domain-containing protein [Leptolyngbyaceae cyanobacterium SM2_3_12]